MNLIKQKGFLFVISSPSGVGKTTLCRLLVDTFENLSFSVSYTTRPPRNNEKNGIDYYFIDETTFLSRIEQNAFAEWASVYKYYYGTDKSIVESHIEHGKDILFDIDYHGAISLKNTYPEDTVLVFLLPPSMNTLEERLKKRGTESTEIIQHRLSKAKEEINQYFNYDFILINDKLSETLEQLKMLYQTMQFSRRKQEQTALRLLNEI